MRIKRLPEDFRVQEHVTFPDGEGPYAYYRVEKQGVSTPAVRDAMAARLKVSPSQLVFPALKDKAAETVQYASVRKRGPEEITGTGYRAQRVGWGPRALRPKDLGGNRFTVVVREMTAEQADRLEAVVDGLQSYGLPNYFDDQRFGSLTKDGFIGKQILLRDAERVVHMYLAEPMAADRREVRRFKRLVSTHWGQWGYLLHQAPRPSNFRSVITYLKDHPHDYRKAANLIKDRLLSIYLSAYQSWVWNQIVATYLVGDGTPSDHITIMRTSYPLPRPGPAVRALQAVFVELPRLTAQYDGAFGEAAEEVLRGEGLGLRDFKARILRRVYLTKGERPVAFAPTECDVSSPTADEGADDLFRATVAFTLGPGQYATLVLKAAAALTGATLRVR